MSFLYECGRCGALCQVESELLTQNQQKLSCPECHASNDFGHWQKPSLDSPILESVRPEDALDNVIESKSILDLPIQWKCGTCESPYQFHSLELAKQGTKVTCIKCLNFFVLRPIQPMKGLSPIVVESTTATADARKEPNTSLNQKTTIVQTHEIVEVFEKSKKRDKTPFDNPAQETVIRAGYVDSRKPKKPSTSSTDIPKGKNETSLSDIKQSEIPVVEEEPVDIPDLHQIAL